MLSFRGFDVAMLSLESLLLGLRKGPVIVVEP